MTTSAPNQTIGTSLLTTPISLVSASSVLVGPSTSVANKFGGSVAIWFGRVTTSAPTVGVSFRLEKQYAASGLWVPVATYTTGIVAANSAAMSSVSSAVLTVASGGASFTAQQVALLSDGTQANSEWGRVVSSTSTTITFEENLLNSHTTGTAYNQAEMFTFEGIDLSNASHLRMVVDGSAHNRDCLVRAILNSFDSVANT